MKTIGITGAGSWGTALATVLAGKGHKVRIWDIDEKHLKSMEEHRENVDYLPGVPLDDNIEIVYTTEDALKDADVVLFSAPAQHFREALASALAAAVALMQDSTAFRFSIRRPSLQGPAPRHRQSALVHIMKAITPTRSRSTGRQTSGCSTIRATFPRAGA